METDNLTKSAWKLSKGRYAYIMPRGKRGIAGTLKEARRKARGGRRRTTSRKSRRRRRKTTRRKRKRRTKTVPLAPVIGLAAGMVSPTARNPSGLIEYLRTGNWQAALNVAATNLTGFVPQTGEWRLQDAHALQGVIVGGLIHKAASWLGINRYFGHMPAPLNKVRV